MAKKAVKKEEKKEEVVEAVKKDTVDISDFFTTSRAKAGIWHEPKIGEIGIGIELKILGSSANEAIVASAEYEVEHERIINGLKGAEAVEAERKALSKRAAALVTGARGKSGKTLVNGKKDFECTKEALEELMYENDFICFDVIRVSEDSTEYIKK